MIIDQSSQGSGESSALPTFDIGSKLAELKQTRKLGTAITMKVVTNFDITNNMLLFTIDNNISYHKSTDLRAPPCTTCLEGRWSCERSGKLCWRGPSRFRRWCSLVMIKMPTVLC